MPKLAFPVLSYFLGSIPFGFIVAYLVKEIDIRNFGSGNIGATNVFRVVGKGWGIFVFILDFLKGFLPLVLTKFLLTSPQDNYIFVLVAVMSVCGHSWTIFLKFKGGKGVATSLGAMSGLSFIFPELRLVILLALCVWALVFLISRIVSLASLCAIVSFFIFSLLLVK